MEETPQQILDQALRLPESDRAALAASLLSSLDAEIDSDAEEKWDAEIKRRLEEIDNGTVELVPLSVVREKLDRIRNG
jgi:putative addiction module component (TIGR02574 family)